MIQVGKRILGISERTGARGEKKRGISGGASLCACLVRECVTGHRLHLVCVFMLVSLSC